jgi:RecB family exonuclease
MFQVHSGPFHPVLEDAYAATVRALKTSPFAAVAVVTPSGGLKRRAERILAERGIAALNVHFLTIGLFAEEIAAAGKDKLPCIVPDPLFFDTLVKQILKKDRPFPGMADLAVPEGFPPSVRSTLRDLIDAGVDPQHLLDAVNQREEFNIPEVDAGSLKQLINLYRLYLNRMKELNVASRSHVLEAAAQAAPGSAYLKGFAAVVFYGFYDMTGLQAGLLDSVARHHATHFFFPYLHRHPDHAFGARFRGDVLHKIPHEERVLAEAVEPYAVYRGPAALKKEAGGALPRVLSWEDAPNGHGPGKTAAELRITNVSGLRDEAWVIASEVLRIHDAGVPFSDIAVVARTRERLAQFPAAFAERQIPFSTSWKRKMAEMPQVEVGLGLLGHVSGVGLSQEFRRSPDIHMGTEEPDAWPPSASWNDSAERAAAAIDRYVDPSITSRDAWSVLREGILALREFDRLSTQVSREDFLDALKAKWSATDVPVDNDAIGVAVLHAEAARGLPFDTVFLAGLEERVFPRVIREDPFLRDKTRLAIVNTIGNKIGEKMLALAEERLLLHLTLHSARRRIFVTYQRSDDEGKIVGASAFLRRLVSEWGVAFDDAVNVVPRRLGAKLAAADPATLGTRDLVSSLLMEGRGADAAALASAVDRDGAALTRSAAALARLESWEAAGPFDALVGEEIGARHLAAEGMSPSGLESLGRCAFQYFVGRVLRLSELREAAAPDEIAADLKGKLVHRFLETFYRRCLEKFGKSWPTRPPEKIFDEAFDAVFAERPPEIYPLLWTALRRGLKDRIFRAVAADFATLAERGLVPAFFEQPHASPALDPAFGDVRFHGVMDRIDVGPDRARVVDYKTGRRSSQSIETLSVKGKKAQPPVYLLMAAEFLRSKGVNVPDIDFAYIHVDEEEPLSEIGASSWAGVRPKAVATIAAQLEAVRKGRFTITPDRHCDWCQAAVICRKTDSISVFRLSRFEGAP